LMAEQELPSIDIVLDEARRKLAFQFKQIDSLDTKSGIVLGINGVLMALLIPSIIGQSDLPNLILVKVALIPIFVSLIIAFISIATRRWDSPPQLERLRSYYINQDANDTKLKIIDIMMDAVRKNEKPIEEKICLWRWSYSVLAFGLGLLAVWVITVIFQ
jgi:hypothetical protein